MITKVETITPKRAQLYLERNPNNRPLRKSHVLFLAKQMSLGEWQVTHQGIAFDENGDLSDGQHRLAAIVKVGVPVAMMVTYGVARGKFTAFDTGIGRTNSDVTGINRNVVSVINVLVAVYSDANLGPKVMPQETLRFAKVFQPELTELAIHSTACKATSRATLRAAAVFAKAQGNKQAMEKYRSLSLLNFEEMTPIVCSLARFLLGQPSRGGTTARADEFARAMWAFQDKNSQIEKLYVRDVQMHMRRIREEIRELIQHREAMRADEIAPAVASRGLSA